MPLMLSLLAVTATCVPSVNPDNTNSQVVEKFFAALNAADQEGMGSYLKPGAMFVIGPGDQLELAGFLGSLSPGARIDVSNVKSAEGNSVTLDFKSSEGNAGQATVKLEGGCITQLAAAH
jgi:hypothetical protein